MAMALDKLKPEDRAEYEKLLALPPGNIQVECLNAFYDRFDFEAVKFTDVAGTLWRVK